ncbi:stage III sporulation protein AE [Pontibacillus chungwhensis BH030062]|uniref:Stage III sporulation protein AE n=1 Tax=Pontibacillus chungwhensis BH030062 TaxID=1385513 RepID=A0A0A2UVI8_9BACI|nr:stage III sporulation protein AE [Pontibacillus chungwhensis]KGP91924.1 stage III sporulation protein AE [Pontibacillus chungwhensis BH030062]
MKLIHQMIIVVILAFSIVLFLSEPVQAQTSPAEETSPTIDPITFTEIQSYWNQVVDEYGGYLPGIRKGSFVEFMENRDSLSVKDWILGLLKYLFYEFLINGKLLGTLIFLTLFCMILQSLQNAFENQTVSKVAYAVVYLVLIVLALNSFHLAVSYAKDAVEMMSSFMIALLPLMLGLMATFGNLLSVSFFHPVIVFLIHTSGLLVSNVVLPLLFLSALLMIVSTINDQYKVTQLAQLLRNTSLGLLGAFLTIFLGVISVQGATSAIQDGVAMKTAKFVTGNFVPVVGRMFTDATDTVLSASLLLKNTVGIVGVLIILALALFPAVKVLAVALIYKLAAAILQPIGGGPVIASMETISKHILFVFAALLVVTFMFFLAIVILVAASNLTMMVR